MPDIPPEPLDHSRECLDHNHDAVRPRNFRCISRCERCGLTWSMHNLLGCPDANR